MTQSCSGQVNALLRAGGTGGHHLRPKVSPRAGVSLAGEHNISSYAYIENRLFVTGPRADHVASAETCVKSHQRWNFTVCSARGGDANSDRNAHDRDAVEKSVFCCLATRLIFLCKPNRSRSVFSVSFLFNENRRVFPALLFLFWGTFPTFILRRTGRSGRRGRRG